MDNDFCKTHIEFTNTESLISDIEHEQRKMVLIISDSAIKRYKIDDRIEKIICKDNVVCINDSVSYPNQKTIFDTLNKIGKLNPEVIYAVGGGSTIDLAKVIKAFYRNESYENIEQITEMLLKKDFCNNKIQIVAVPTTAGTGAEVTKWATVWDINEECKYSVDADYLKPELAYIIPELMLCAGKELTISAGLDSLSHAIEAYWSRKTNPLVRELSSHSIMMITKYLKKVVENPQNIEYREKMGIASLLAGMAFSMTRTTACHSISYPLTMKYGVPHGIAVAMTLPNVMEKNSHNYVGENELINMFSAYGGLKNYIEEICRLDAISLKLSDYGMKRNEVESIVKKTFTIGRMDNNPKSLSELEVEEILLDIYV